MTMADLREAAAAEAIHFHIAQSTGRSLYDTERLPASEREAWRTHYAFGPVHPHLGPVVMLLYHIYTLVWQVGGDPKNGPPRSLEELLYGPELDSEGSPVKPERPKNRAALFEHLKNRPPESGTVVRSLSS